MLIETNALPLKRYTRPDYYYYYYYYKCSD